VPPPVSGFPPSSTDSSSVALINAAAAARGSASQPKALQQTERPIGITKPERLKRFTFNS
jgi:hypothetical protein